MTAVAIVMFTTTLASNAPSPLYVVYQRQFGFSQATLTWIFAAYAFGVLASLVTIGRVSDELGRKRVMVPSLAVLGLSAVLFAAAQGTEWLLVARVVLGLATGALTAAATAAIVELEPNGDRRHASFINTVSFICGAAGGPLLVGILIEYAPAPRVLPFAIELLLVVVGLVLLVRVPETVNTAGGFTWRLQKPHVPRAIRHAFLAASLTLAASWAVGALYGALSGSIDRQVLHVSNHAAAGAVLFAFAGLGGLSQVALRHWPSRATMLLGAALLCIGMVLVGLSLGTRSVAVFILGTVFGGLGGGLTFMGSLALLNDVAHPARRAEVVSAFNLVGYLALSVPVVGVGTLATHVGLEHATEIFTIAVVAVATTAALLTLTLKKHQFARVEDDALVAVGLEPGIGAAGVE